MDVIMPMLDGDRKVRRMKAREETCRIPVVLMSTKSAAELQGIARASGADGFLPKPLNRAALLDMVRRFV
jgi:two-component system, OmpR family, alkaline phosphatase synthesis response regulator PhoP